MANDPKKYSGEATIAAIARNVKSDIKAATTVEYELKATYIPAAKASNMYLTEASLYGETVSQPDAEGGYGYIYVNANGNDRSFFRKFLTEATGVPFTVQFSGYNLGATNGLYINGLFNDDDGYHTVFLPVVDKNGVQMKSLEKNKVYSITVNPSESYEDNARKAVLTVLGNVGDILPGGHIDAIGDGLTLSNGTLKFDKVINPINVMSSAWDDVLIDKVNVYTDEDGVVTAYAGETEITGIMEKEICNTGDDTNSQTAIENAIAIVFDDEYGALESPASFPADSLAIGRSVSITATGRNRGGAIAIGSGASIDATSDSYAITGAIAIGKDAEAYNKSSIALGESAVAGNEETGANGIAIGQNAAASGVASVAIGFGAEATEDYTFAVGSADEKRRVVNVAAATADNDAVIKKQLDDAVEDLENKITAVPKFGVKVVETLPTENISPATVYFVRNEQPDGVDIFAEYIYVLSDESGVPGTWEKLGSQPVLTPEEEISAADVDAIWAAAGEES